MGTEIDEQHRILAFKMFAKVWSAYCRHLVHQVTERSRAVMCPVFGIFSTQKALRSFDLIGMTIDENNSCVQMRYMPSKLLMDSQECSYEPVTSQNLDFVPADLLNAGQVFRNGVLERVNFS